MFTQDPDSEGALCKEDGERFKASPVIYNTNCTIHSSKDNSHPRLSLPFSKDLNGQPKPCLL